MMAADQINIPILPNIGGDPSSATPFERWKMQQFLYSPDTPAASENHDKQVVDMLTMAATSAYNEKRSVTRPTKTIIAKMTKPLTLPNMTKSSSPSSKSKKDPYFLETDLWYTILI